MSPSAVEPEGHVFEMILQNQTLKFAAADPEARSAWVDLIEEKLKEKLKSQDFSPSLPTSPSHGQQRRESATNETSPSVTTALSGVSDKGTSGTAGVGDSLGKYEATPDFGPMIGCAVVHDGPETFEDALKMSAFRLKVMKTQMFNYLNGLRDFGAWSFLKLTN